MPASATTLLALLRLCARESGPARLAAVDSEWLQEHPGKGAKGGKGKPKRKR